MRKSIASLVWLAAAIVHTVSPARAEPLAGTWLTEDTSTHVRFVRCADAVCGQIVWLRDPIDPETGKPWRDKFNPDDAAKRRPLEGLTMISGLKEAGEGRWTGELYNPQDGKTYTGTFRALGADKIVLEGCALAGLLCESETWTRIAP